MQVAPMAAIVFFIRAYQLLCASTSSGEGFQLVDNVADIHI